MNQLSPDAAFAPHVTLPDPVTCAVSVVGLGYVGLPLAVAFGAGRPVIGFDVNAARVTALRSGRDATREVSEAELAGARSLEVTEDPKRMTAPIHIITVPTPIDAHRQPDLGPLRAASKTVGAVLKPGDIVIYESTVYPGAIEEVCVPVLEAASGLEFNVDFFAGYSPERINPGDRTHRLPDIVKVTAGSTPDVAKIVDQLYGTIIKAGTFRAESIRVAEAAKVIENTQRDLNIALVNELALIFNRLGIDTEAVLEAAATKWNFLPFRPGLVGGHCIGVDPYYLTHKAEAVGYHPQIILSGRRLNDGMGGYVASSLVKAMLAERIQVEGARVLVMGLAFKENCPDIRNTKVIDVITELRDYGVRVDVHDPWVDPAEARAEYGLEMVEIPEPRAYDGIVLAVAHDAFQKAGAEAARSYGRKYHVLYDLKYAFPRNESDLRL